MSHILHIRSVFQWKPLIIKKRDYFLSYLILSPWASERILKIFKGKREGNEQSRHLEKVFSSRLAITVKKPQLKRISEQFLQCYELHEPGVHIKEIQNSVKYSHIKVLTPYQTNGLDRRDLTTFASPVFKTGVQAFIQYILLSCEVRILIGYPPKETKTVTCQSSQFTCIIQLSNPLRKIHKIRHFHLFE